MTKRSNRMGMVVLLFLLSTSYVFAKGEGAEWDTLNKKVTDLNRTGNDDRAETVTKKSLEVAEKNAGLVATSLNNRALWYVAQGKYSQAEPLSKRALAISEKVLGPDHRDVAMSLENLAALYRATNRKQEAKKLKQRAARIRAIISTVLTKEIEKKEYAKEAKILAKWKLEGIEFVIDEKLDNNPRRIVAVPPSYPFILNRAGIKGEVRLIILIDEHGKVIDAKVQKATHRFFVKPAINAVLQWEFEPGIMNGKAVKVSRLQPITFMLK